MLELQLDLVLYVDHYLRIHFLKWTAATLNPTFYLLQLVQCEEEYKLGPFAPG